MIFWWRSILWVKAAFPISTELSPDFLVIGKIRPACIVILSVNTVGKKQLLS